MAHDQTEFLPVMDLDESRYRLSMLADLLAAANTGNLDLSDLGICGLTSLLRESVQSEGRAVDHINQRNGLRRAA